ncbi:MAG: hypothetical protein MMC23_006149 [Stictis urceolatum]|nr:hypothetical protein [Stictis urceolata]
MGVLSIALDPVSPRYEQLENQPKVASSAETLTFLSASSDREIRQWLIQPRMVSESSSEFLLEASRLYFRAPQSEPQEALTPLPTSVNQILFFSRHESTSSEYPIAVCDLLACSASGGIALLSRACNWINNTIKLSHGEQNGVRALATSSDGMLVVSGGRDEDVWLWDLEEKERIGRWRGHADEIMGLGWLKGTDGEGLVVSASLDRTVRTWEVGKQQEGWIEGSEEIRLSEDKDERRGEATGMHEGGIRTKGLELTAEEEAELDELMEDE